MIAGVCLSVCVFVRLSVSLTVCSVPRPNSRMERPGKAKISRMEATVPHYTSSKPIKR